MKININNFYDAFFDTKLYNTADDADKNNDLFIVTLLGDTFHIKTPDGDCHILKLQYLPKCGVDQSDDKNLSELVNKLIIKKRNSDK